MPAPAEEDHEMLGERAPQVIYLRGPERPSEVDLQDFGADQRCERPNADSGVPGRLGCAYFSKHALTLVPVPRAGRPA